CFPLLQCLVGRIKLVTVVPACPGGVQRIECFVPAAGAGELPGTLNLGVFERVDVAQHCVAQGRCRVVLRVGFADVLDVVPGLVEVLLLARPVDIRDQVVGGRQRQAGTTADDGQCQQQEDNGV